MIGVVHRGRLRRNLLIYGDPLGLNPWRFGVIGFAIGMIATVFELGGADRFLGLSLFLQFIGAVGLFSATRYLFAVRRWLSAQLRFANSSPPQPCSRGQSPTAHFLGRRDLHSRWKDRSCPKRTSEGHSSRRSRMTPERQTRLP